VFLALVVEVMEVLEVLDVEDGLMVWAMELHQVLAVAVEVLGLLFLVKS
jgi:hypothetical protein